MLVARCSIRRYVADNIGLHFMEQNQIIEGWLKYLENKVSSGSYYRLQERIAQDYEFRGKQWGHPSNYAHVSFDCKPADELSFYSVAEWPNTLPPEYCTKLEEAISRGIADGLIGESFTPYRGCSLTLVRVIWDDVMSSEVAFHRAARSAMKELISKGKWQFVLPERSGAHSAT